MRSDAVVGFFEEAQRNTRPKITLLECLLAAASRAKSRETVFSATGI
jgi:hypothetical protein